MGKYVFTATHGVQFAEEVPATKTEPARVQVWAQFERAHDLDTPDGQKRFRFTTDDDEVAARLRGVDEYGITEGAAGESEPEPAAVTVEPESEPEDDGAAG